MFHTPFNWLPQSQFCSPKSAGLVCNFLLPPSKKEKKINDCVIKMRVILGAIWSRKSEAGLVWSWCWRMRWAEWVEVSAVISCFSVGLARWVSLNDARRLSFTSWRWKADLNESVGIWLDHFWPPINCRFKKKKKKNVHRRSCVYVRVGTLVLR